MVVYYPKNGKCIQINGFPIHRQGYPCQFPVEPYERAVKSGFLVKTPQEMDPLSPEDMKKEMEKAKEANVPIYVPKETESSDQGFPVDTQQVDEVDEEPVVMDEYNKEMLERIKAEVSSKKVGNQQPVLKQEEKPVEEIKQNTITVTSPNGTTMEVPALTYEMAVDYIKTNPDGSFKIGKDGLYVLKAGWKPYSKQEICDLVKNH